MWVPVQLRVVIQHKLRQGIDSIGWEVNLGHCDSVIDAVGMVWHQATHKGVFVVLGVTKWKLQHFRKVLEDLSG